jgi:hypothetical protein
MHVQTKLCGCFRAPDVWEDLNGWEVCWLAAPAMLAKPYSADILASASKEQLQQPSADAEVRCESHDIFRDHQGNQSVREAASTKRKRTRRVKLRNRNLVLGLLG